MGLRSSVPPATAQQLGKPLMDTMCELAVTERRERLRALSTARRDHVARVGGGGDRAGFRHQRRQVGSTAVAAGAAPPDDPRGVPETLAGTSPAHISNHLDPYIDGEITSPEEERGHLAHVQTAVRGLRARLRARAARAAEVVLALYVRHGICKANATQCFTDLVMGQGGCRSRARRRTATARPSAARSRRPSHKDFGAVHSRRSRASPISAALIESLAKEHSNKLFVDHQKNAERLAEANRLGELGRKEEMKRIFGIDI